MNLCAEMISPVESSKMPIGVGPSELIRCFSSVTEATSEPVDELHERSSRFGMS